ncbi:unnamed protein product, partial [Effrenium voratum]
MSSDGCPHDVVFAGMCCHCGAAAEGEVRPGFITTELKVSSSVLRGLEQGRQGQRRLALILDLDHTLVTASEGKIWHRPGLRPFLQVQEFCDLYVYTQATGHYAQQAVASFDPGGTLQNRIFHRENTPAGLKDLTQIFPSNASWVLVADDREDVWPQEVRDSQVLKVLPYLPFPEDLRQAVDLEGLITGQVQAPATPFKRRRLDSSKAYCAATVRGDQQLKYLAEILRRLHEALQEGEGEESVSTMRAAVQRLRGQTLAGCRLCLTGLRQQAKLRLERCCLLLGAEVAALPEGATHVVAAQRTEKLWRARSQEVAVVHPGWLLRAFVTWQRPCEQKFQVPFKGQLPCFLDIWDEEPRTALDDSRGRDPSLLQWAT